MSSDKVDLYYFTVGEGPPLLILHGGPGWDHHYLLQGLTPLSSTHTLIFFDQRCTGQSTGTPTADTITLDKFLQDIAALQRGLGYDTWQILGHSWGALLALAYAQQHPEKVSSLTLLHPIPFESTGLHKLAELTLLKQTTDDQERLAEMACSIGVMRKQKEALNQFFQLWFKPYFYDPSQAASLQLISQDRTAANGLAVNALMRTDLKRRLPLKQLKSLSCPIRVVTGSDDLVSLAWQEPIQNYLPQATVQVLPQCGHFSFIEAPDRLRSHLSML